jgi:regulator of protease activity HflC (stomatin/prohibitin superfamily)
MMIGRLKKILRAVKFWLKRIWYRHKFKIVIFVLVTAFLLAYLWQNIFISIHPGHAGVLWKRLQGGTVTDKVYGEGLHIIFPWDKMYDYSLRIQERHNQMKILTAAGLYLEVDFSYRFYPERKGFQVDPEHVPPPLEAEDKEYLPLLHQKWGPNYADKFVEPEAKAAAIAVLGDTPPKELYSLSTKLVQTLIRKKLEMEFGESYIALHDFLITRLALPKTIKDAIERKLTQEQLNMEYSFRLEVERKERDRKQIEAEGISIFEAISGIDILKWRGLDVTSEIAKSENAKVVVIGSGKDGLPIILNAEK